MFNVEPCDMLPARRIQPVALDRGNKYLGVQLTQCLQNTALMRFIQFTAQVVQ